MIQKFLFLDIDGVLTPTANFIPGKAPIIKKETIDVLKKFQKQKYNLVFITARSSIELRTKNGFESLLKKNNLLKDSIIYGANGMEHITYADEFKLKNGKPIFKNGNAIITLQPVIKRESFGRLDELRLFKIDIGREIKKRLEQAGFKLKNADGERILNDVRFFFEIENNTSNNRKKAINECKQIIKDLRKAFRNTKVHGSPVDLIVIDIKAGIAIEPKELGKYFGVLRALKHKKITSKNKIIGYAFGDKNSDRAMKIRKDIKFFKVKNNKEFLETANKILNKN